MFAATWKAFKQGFRIAMVLAIATGVTILAYLIRPDWVGLLAGSALGLFTGYLFVYADWFGLSE